MKKSNQYESLYVIIMGLMMATNIVGGKPNDYKSRSPDLSSVASYKIFGETSYFDPNQLIPVLENRRYIFRAANDQIHVVEVITDPFGTSTKAYQIENVNESKQAQTNPTVAPSIKHTPAFPSVDSRLDAAAMKFINHSPYQIGSWLSHGFTSVVPPQTQFQHIFMPSPLPSMSIVVPFAVVFNPYASTSSSPSLIHNSEKPINPELINSIFQIPPNEHKNDNNHYTGGISTSLQPPFQTSTPPPQISSSTSKPSASSTPNYFGTNGTPTRPSYLPPTESAINNFDIRKFKFASTETPSVVFNNRFLIGNDDDNASTDLNLSMPKPSTELLPPFED